MVDDCSDGSLTWGMLVEAASLRDEGDNEFDLEDIEFEVLLEHPGEDTQKAPGIRV